MFRPQWRMQDRDATTRAGVRHEVRHASGVHDHVASMALVRAFARSNLTEAQAAHIGVGNSFGVAVDVFHVIARECSAHGSVVTFEALNLLHGWCCTVGVKL